MNISGAQSPEKMRASVAITGGAQGIGKSTGAALIRRGARVAIGDLSRPHGGDFGPQFGSIGHASHQNGLDVDVYYPRIDHHVRPPARPGQVDLRLAQDLVDRFVAAGAEKVFVGPSLGLGGPAGVVVPLANHDNHLHARLPL